MLLGAVANDNIASRQRTCETAAEFADGGADGVVVAVAARAAAAAAASADRLDDLLDCHVVVRPLVARQQPRARRRPSAQRRHRWQRQRQHEPRVVGLLEHDINFRRRYVEVFYETDLLLAPNVA